MNEQKQTKYLASYKEWLTKNPSVANEAKQEQMEAQQKAHAFTKKRLLSMSEDDLFEYLSPHGPWRCGAISIISHAMRQDWTGKCMHSYPASDEKRGYIHE